MSRTPGWIAERTGLAIAAVAVLLGAGARVWALTHRGSLFLDEAELALNVLGRSYGGLLHPLDWGQAAPVGFLWLQRLVASHADAPEPWLRVVPFLAGAALPALMYLLARRTVGSGAGALAAVASAGSMLALRYSTEAKPYAVDAGLTALLLVLAHAVLEEPERRARWWRLGVVAMVAVLCSMPSVFVIAGIGVTIALTPSVRTRAEVRQLALPVVALCAVVFVALWFTSYGASSASGRLRDYWAPVMLSPFEPGLFVRVVRVLMQLTWVPLQWTGSLIGAAVGTTLWVGGLAVVGRTNRRDALLLAAPVGVAALASMFSRYPLSDRLAFFAVPCIWAAQASALIGVRNVLISQRSQVNTARRAAVFAVVTSLLLAMWQWTDSERFLRAPGSLEPTRELFAAIDRDAGETPVYVFARSAPAWLMATHDGAWTPDDARLAQWTRLAGAADAPAYENLSRPRPVRAGEGDSLVVVTAARRELVGLAPGVQYRIAGAPVPMEPSEGWATEEARRLHAAAAPSVWIVASHFFANSPRNELRPLLEAAEGAGLRVVEERRAGDDVLAVRLERQR